MKKKRRETCLYSLSDSHSSLHQVIFVTFASAATCHLDKEDSPPPAHSPPVHQFTSGLQHLRSPCPPPGQRLTEQLFFYLFNLLFSFYISSNFNQGGSLPSPQQGAAL